LIYQALRKDFSQQLIVNRYYPFKEGLKVGFRITELDGPNILHHFALVRYFVRYLELLFYLLVSTLYIASKKPRIVNYSLISNLKIEYYFFCVITRVLRSHLIITCHDAVPFRSLMSHRRVEATRKRIYSIADHILVHNEFSKRILIRHYGCAEAKLIMTPFPPMELPERSGVSVPVTHKFAFVGHLREEKGVNVLVEAWLKYKGSVKDDSEILLIAGNLPFKTELGFSCQLADINRIQLRLGYLGRTEFFDTLASTKYLVLPYLKGSNSGFPSLAISCGCIPLVSSIESFTELDFLSPDCYFDAGSSEKLKEKFEYLHENEIGIEKLKQRLEIYKDRFKNETRRIYGALLTRMSTSE